MRGDRNAIVGIARLANDCRRPVGADGIHCARIQHKERGRNRPSSASWRADLMEITAAPHVIGADFQRRKSRTSICERGLKRQGSLSLSPIDDLERHAPSKHFEFQGRCVFLPFWRIADLERRLATLAFGRVIGSQSTTYGSVHHREAVIRESLIINLLS